MFASGGGVVSNTVIAACMLLLLSLLAFFQCFCHTKKNLYQWRNYSEIILSVFMKKNKYNSLKDTKWGGGGGAVAVLF